MGMGCLAQRRTTLVDRGLGILGCSNVCVALAMDLSHDRTGVAIALGLLAT